MGNTNDIDMEVTPSLKDGEEVLSELTKIQAIEIVSNILFIDFSDFSEKKFKVQIPAHVLSALIYNYCHNNEDKSILDYIP